MSLSLDSRTMPITSQGTIATSRQILDQPPHGPGGVGRVAVAERAAGWSRRATAGSTPPGQRFRLPVSKPLSFCEGSIAVSVPPEYVDGQEHRLHAGVVAVGVVVGGDLAEVGDPGGEVGRVAARRTRTPAGRGRASGSRAGTPIAVSCARRGCLAVSSIRSLFVPGLRGSACAGRRPSGAPRARAAAARAGSGASSLVAGFDSSTSWSRSSSVERRFTNVVFALRSVLGSSSSARSSAALSSPIARKAVLVLRDEPGQVVAALGDRRHGRRRCRSRSA